jgi:hypothetical protein
MLAFNLGVFFRNLAGADVEFTARNAAGEVHFVGNVQDLREETDIRRRLQVTLRRDALRCEIQIEESEDEAHAGPDGEPEVEVRLEQESGAQTVPLFHGRFRFEDISLNPHAREPAPEGTAPQVG